MTKSIFATTCIGIFTAATVAFSQPTANSPDPRGGAETSGSIKEYTPGVSLVLEMLPPTEPMQFKLSKSVVYVDTDGKPVDAPGLTTNQKVRVHYIKMDGENVADRVSLIKQ